MQSFSQALREVFREQGEGGLHPMALTQAKTRMHPESDYGRMIGSCFAKASTASPPAVYFAKQLPIIRLLPTTTNVMGLCLNKRESDLRLVFQPRKKSKIFTRCSARSSRRG